MCALSPATVSAAGAEGPAILVLGDSLSAGYGLALDQGWVGRLSQRLRAGGYRHRLVNASISGDTTAGGLARVDAAVAGLNSPIVILELGANDGLRGVSPRVTRANLAAIVARLKRGGASVLLVGMRLPPNYGQAYIRRFEAIYPDLAREFDLPLVPFLLRGVAGNADLMQADGLHPQAEAQEIILDNVWPHLEPLLASPGEAGDAAPEYSAPQVDTP